MTLIRDSGQQPVATFGFVDVTQAPFFAKPGTDASHAIQLALNTVAAGVTVLVPAAALPYTIGTEVTMPRSVVLWARGATFKAKAGSNLTQLFSATDVGAITIDGGIFDANNDAKNCVSWFANAASPFGFWVQNATFQNTKADATLNFAGLRALSLGGLNAAHKWSGFYVSQCTFKNLGTHGFFPVFGAYGSMTQCYIDTTQNHGAEMLADHYYFDDNDVLNTTFDGLAIGGKSKFSGITNNRLTNCAIVQDAAISIESEDIHCVVSGNVLVECPTVGISISFNSVGVQPPPNDTPRNILVTGNVVRASAANTTGIGVNAYGSTAQLANGLRIDENTIDGFNRGVVLSFAQFCSVSRNTVTTLTGVGSFVVQCVFCNYTDVEDNLCDSVTGDHAYQAITQVAVPANQPDNMRFSRNTVATSGAAGAKALVYFEGTGFVSVQFNRTGGSSSFLKTNAAATYQLFGNTGGLTVGTTELAAGAAPVSSGPIVIDSIRTGSGSNAAVVSGAATTMFAVPNTKPGLWRCVAYATGSVSSFQAVADISNNGAGALLLRTSSGSASFVISLAGTNVQITQTSGGPQPISWVFEWMG